ncbi:hypothetical protein OROGR_032051 [Orobanche gracilis]
MLLQPTIPKPPPNHPNLKHNHFYYSNAISVSSGLLNNPTFFLKQPIISTICETHKNPVSITCSSLPQVYSSGTVDRERKQIWNSIYKKIHMLENSPLGPASVLNQMENEGKRISKWVLSKVVKELRKFRRYKFALEVYEWMNSRPERFRITTSDTAIQLDLIAKVHGISSAEQYFVKLPDTLKDKRIYGSLLNSYTQSKMTEKAESLMDDMRSKNYTNHPFPFNVMMTLYMKLKDDEKVESLITEMMEKEIALDTYTYNIWLTSCGSKGFLEKMEHVFQQMELDNTVNPSWITFSTMATTYIKSGHFEKAEDCLRKIESQAMGWDRMPYHYLISIYGTAGKKEEVYRIWNIYRALFVNIMNLGYHTMISALVRANDIDGAERIYDEWLSVKSTYDPRVGNVLLSFYVRKGHSEKAKTFFDQMLEIGGKPNSMTWEIVSEDHVRNMRISEALSCLRSASLAEGSKSWKPKPTNVRLILEIVERGDDVANKNALLDILRQVGCFDNETYMSHIPSLGGGKYASSVSVVEDSVDSDEGNAGNFILLEEVQESL